MTALAQLWMRGKRFTAKPSSKHFKSTQVISSGLSCKCSTLNNFRLQTIILKKTQNLRLKHNHAVML